jgi:hypothetical protein
VSKGLHAIQLIPKGEALVLFYASASRDEDVFPDPFTFDVARKPNTHLAFGYGEHFCMGAHFARRSLVAGRDRGRAGAAGGELGVGGGSGVDPGEVRGGVEASAGAGEGSGVDLPQWIGRSAGPSWIRTREVTWSVGHLPSFS